MFDHHPGRVCSFRPERPEGVETCGAIMGRGVDLFASTAVGAQFKSCRYYTHSIYHFYRATQNTSTLYTDGTTSYGCKTMSIESCPSYSPSAGYVLISISFIVLFGLVFFLLLVLIPRVIYVKTCGRPKSVIPDCMRSCCCRRDKHKNKKAGDIEMTDPKSIVVSS
eukprot:TRINITY_DN8945_c0_g1_i1.p1 TRINITY_DN8945_c0_g1~~TRINITY_DN8945_c0_g1_i1.p1  ORF type:complete len:166 (-),score=14.37 TRINITY_DN8945_c0_g1_i1:37-534(-)